MYKNNNRHHPNLRHGLLATAILASLGHIPAQAFEVETGNEDLKVRFDNTLKFNYAQRVESPNSKLANAFNNNDGDRNFSSGSATSQRIDLLSELDVVYKQQAGFRVSANTWYDHAYEKVGSANPATNQIHNGRPDSRRLSSYTERYYNGPSAEFLDAFVFTTMEIGDESMLGIKAGQHTVYWGENVLSLANGISYGQSGVDAYKAFGVPGTEAKELFIPRNQVSMSFTATPELTFGAQYFLDWTPSRLPESGTYLGFSDAIQHGSNDLSLIAQPNPMFGVLPGAPQYLRLNGGHTYEPDKHGDFGLMARWSPDWLDGTLGFYYRKTSDTLPNVALQPSTVGLAELQSGNIGTYHQLYADDIDIYGISLAKNIAGISLGMELSYRENMPLNSVAATISPAAAAREVFGSASDIDDAVARGRTLHAVVNGLASFAESPVWDGASLLVELSYGRWLEVTDNEQLFKGNSAYRGDDHVTKDNYLLGVNFNPVWYQVFPGIDMYMPMSITTGLDGQSAVQLGGNKNSGNYSVGVGVDIQNQYRFDLKYVDYFGTFDTCETGNDGASPGASNDYACTLGQITSGNAFGNLKDRGTTTLTFKTTF